MRGANKTMGILIALAGAVAFGAYPPATRAVYADGGNAAFMIFFTTWFRALALVVFCLLTRKAIFKTRTDTKNAITGGFFQSISIVGITASLVYLPGPIMIIIFFTHTLMLLFFMAWRREIKLTASAIITTITALLGLSLTLDIWHPRNLSLIGVCLALTSAVATMSRLYVYGKLTKKREPAVVGGEVFLVAATILSAVPLFYAPTLPGSFEGCLWALLSCISLSLGTFATFYAISILGPFQFSLFSKLEPMVTAILSVLFVNEILMWHQYLGMVVVLGSLVVYQYIESRIKIAASQDAL